MSKLGVQNSSLPFRASIDLDGYIQVEEEINEQGLVLFRFVRFNLDKKSIKKILRAKKTGQNLYISKNLRAQLRYCALSDGENSKGENRFQSGLTFCTFYNIAKEAEQESEKMVMRSVIAVDGDIIHQIRRDCLEKQKRCLAIATSHYWLINQLLNQLPIKPTLWLNWLSWGLSLLIVLGMVILYPKNLMSVNPLILLVPLVMWWLLQEGIKRLLRILWPSVRPWFWRQLLLRFFSRKPFEKKIVKGIFKRSI
ncbi:MAG TPA: hypothetical protein V6D12_14435 [Candidatus Obscuribacterales bacterium]